MDVIYTREKNSKIVSSALLYLRTLTAIHSVQDSLYSRIHSPSDISENGKNIKIKVS